MFEFKLQIGCLLILAYLLVSYFKGSADKRIKRNRLFNMLLIVSSVAVFFDGLTAWTVNHLDIVPYWVNLLLHGIFFVSMQLVVTHLYMYMVSQMLGHLEKKKMIMECAPGTIFILLSTIMLKDLYYIHGITTNYSMGLSVKISYFSLVVHIIMILVLVCIRHGTLEKRKTTGIIAFVIFSLVILAIQCVFPETLISSLFPPIAVLGIYINFEDPASKRLQEYNETMVRSFATLVENRDDNTGGHIIRTQGYVKIILEQMQKCKRYKKILTKDYIANVINAAPLHDIGKIGVPDYILQKPGKLTSEEFEIMKKHSANGGDLIQKTFAELDEPDYQHIAFEVARFHHEKWNGKGYPDHLQGKKIPLHARIMAIADVFDAVSAKRCYRDAMPLEKCFKIIEDGVGVDFDPSLAELFLSARKQIVEYINSEKAKNAVGKN